MDTVYETAVGKNSSHDKKIRATHQNCANMRNSRSISSSCLPIRNHDEENTIQFFPVSVCCTSDYCQITKDNNSFSYKCETDDECFLLKNNVTVQALHPGSATLQECVEKYSNENNQNIEKQFTNGGFYYPFTSKELREDICKTSQKTSL